MSLRVLICFWALLIHWGAQAQADAKWTLERCVQYALANNIQVRQAAINAQISKNNNLQSVLNLLPSVDASVNYNFNFGNSLNPVTFRFVEANSQSGSANLQATLPLFTGLQQIHNIQRTKYDLTASKFDYENAQNNVALAVSSAFLQIVLNREVLGVLEKQKQLTQQQKENVASRIRNGALPENAIYETEAQLARDEANIVNARGVYDLSVLALKQLLQLNEGDAFEISVPPLDADNIQQIGNTSATAIYEYAVNNQPSVKGAEFRVKSAQSGIKLAYGALSPTLSAFGSLSTGYFSQDRTITGIDSSNGQLLYRDVPFNEQIDRNFRKVAGFSLNIPIFSRGQRIINISNARLQHQLVQWQLQNAKNTLRQDIEQAYTNARTAAESYQANKKSFEAARIAYSNVEKRFMNGLSSPFELEQVKNSFAVAESEMLRAKYTYIFRLKILDFYKGNPITLN